VGSVFANTTACFRVGKRSQGRDTGKAPPQNPCRAGGYKMGRTTWTSLLRAGTGQAGSGESPSTTQGAKREIQQLCVDPHGFPTVTERQQLPWLPRPGGVPAAATDPAIFESQTLQACHFYLRRFPISRATAFSNCLLGGEKAKFGELTSTRPRAGFRKYNPGSLRTVCTAPCSSQIDGVRGQETCPSPGTCTQPGSHPHKATTLAEPL